jgi:hypothetical protein
MLQFYYDFVDVFVDHRDFQYCAIDTDSAYIALSADTLEEVIKPDLRQVYAEPSVGTGSRLLRQQNIDVIVFGDLVGSPVDPLAAELFFLPETVVGLPENQGEDTVHPGQWLSSEADVGM